MINGFHLFHDAGLFQLEHCNYSLSSFDKWRGSDDVSSLYEVKGKKRS